MIGFSNPLLLTAAKSAHLFNRDGAVISAGTCKGERAHRRMDRCENLAHRRQRFDGTRASLGQLLSERLNTAEVATHGDGFGVAASLNRVRGIAVTARVEDQYDAVVIGVRNDHTSPRNGVCVDAIAMPGIDGVELGKRVRSRWPDIKVVLTSGYSHILASNARHGFDLLHKPYSVDELSQALLAANSNGRKWVRTAS